MSSNQTNNYSPVVASNESNVGVLLKTIFTSASTACCDHFGHNDDCVRCVLRFVAHTKRAAECRELNAKRAEQEAEDAERYLNGEIDADEYYGW